jgi:hypothetical protein
MRAPVVEPRGGAAGDQRLVFSAKYPSRVTSTFEAVRKACSPQLWSRGIELVRAEAVVGERAEPDEIAVRVSTKGGMIARNVRLFLDDAQWECTCGAAVCEHAAAAVIALKRAHDLGSELPTHKVGSGTIAYRFERVPGGLALLRGIRAGDALHPFEATLAALSSGRVPAPPFTARQDDLAVELALGTHRRGPVPRAIVAKLLRALAGCDDISLDGAPVRAASAPVGARVAVTEQGDGFRVALEDDPEISEVFGNGIARCGATLRPTQEPKLTGKEQHEFLEGRHFGPESWNELVTEVLPALRGRVVVDLRTSRLPSIERIPPRIAVETRREGEALYALAGLVYGDPPQARVDGGKLVHLQGSLPLRDERAEQREVRHLSARVGLAPGVPAVVTGADAVKLAAKLAHWDGEVRGSGREHFALEARLAPSVRVRDDGGVDVLFATEAPGRGRRTADAAAVLAAFRAGEALVRLDGGGYAPLPVDWLSRFGARIADLLAARDEAGVVPAALLPDVARLCDDLEQPRPPSFSGLEALLSGFDGLGEPALPGDLTAELAVSAPRRRLARLPAPGGDGRAWPTTWAWENAPGALRRVWPDAGRGAHECRAQLVGRDPALPSGARGLRLPRPEARARSRGRRHDHQLRAASAGRADSLGRRVGLSGFGRGADDQEPREPGGPGRLQAQGELAPHHVGNARREPARRAVEPDAFPEPGPARRTARFSGPLREAGCRGGRWGGREAA